jgi:hypothetical protein
MDQTGRVTPAFEPLTQVFERVAVLGEYEQPPAPVFQLTELGALQAFLEGGQLRVRCVIADAAGLGKELLEGSDLGAELVEADGGSELVGELITLSIIKVILVLLNVREPAL